VVEAHLERIETLNPKVNAVTVTLAEQSLQAADEADRRLAAGHEVGPLHGVPFTVKENVDVTGTATTWGLAAAAGAIADTDAPQVAHLRAAGAIPIGRTNMPDFALRWHTDNALHGPTVNPWDAGRTPGGSSGGEAAALATGMSPLGVGNDLGGSLRWPSQCCGVTAIRPTLGRVPGASVVEPINAPIGIQLFNSQGPMARRVADLRVALEVMSRPSPRDPWYVPAPITGPPVEGPVKVAVVRDPGGIGVDPQVAGGVDRTARELSAAGYAVEEIEPPSIMEAFQGWSQLISWDFEALRAVFEALGSPDALTFYSISRQSLPPPEVGSLASLFVTRQALIRQWSEFLDHHPLVLAPVATVPPFPLGTDLDSMGVAQFVMAMRMVVAVNFLGLPSAAVPVGVADGLPQAVQLIGARFREDVCLDAAEALEGRVGTLAPIDPR